MDEDQILAASVGEPPPQHKEIVVADYDPEWPKWFERAAAKIRGARRCSPPARPCRLDLGAGARRQAADRHQPRRHRHDRRGRVLYERTKRELAAKRWKYTQNYADAKTEVIQQTLARARRPT
jgi:GrpB-like predicted nucleotidyltransferase (UPF0157 family)